MVVARGRKSGTLYLASHVSDTITIAHEKVASDLWHSRLGHMSDNGIKILRSQEKLSGIISVDLSMSEDCIFGK